MPSRHRSGGPIYEVDDAWRDAVDEELAKRKEAGTKPSNRTELAAAIGKDKSTITVLLRRTDIKERGAKAGPKTSVIAKLVADVLDLPLRGQLSENEEHVLSRLRTLRHEHPEAYERAVALIEALARTSPVSSLTGRTRK